MKNKKFFIVIVGVIAVILVGVLGFFILNRNSSFTIPDGYLHKFTSHLSHLDGPDTDYYVYADKVIVEENASYPSGHSTTHERKITLYDELTTKATSLEEVLTALKGKEGRVVLHVKK